MANSSIDMTALDFDALKQSFKNYLANQEVFRDYDFEASNLNLLMELLAYNSFKNAFLSNMVLAESFLDSAQLRNSILSHSKELNYLPRSHRSAVANVRVSFTASGESAPYIIPKGKPFTTLVKNRSYTFTNPETLIVTSTNTSFSFETEIYEGNFLQDSYTYLPGEENQRFKITNPNIDTRSLAVVVFEDNKEVGDTYRYTSTLLDVRSTSKVFFLQPTEDGSYEVLFGDGNIGRQPKDNALIVLEYRVSSGSGPNGARSFSCDFDPTGADELLSSPTVDLLESARDGSDAESDASIKYYAPRHFQVQERAITALDFEVSLKTQYPEINAVHAFGGEDLDPPQYGRVIVAVDIANVNGLPDAKKKEYYAFLKRRTAFTIEPVFIEPEFSYLAIRALVRYNVNVTAISPETINTLVTDAINLYSEEFLNEFHATLRHSKLQAAIDASDDSIVSSILNVSLYKKINPTLGTSQNFNLDFALELRDDIPELEKNYAITDIKAMTSSVFVYKGEECRLEDDGSGKVRIVKIKGSQHETIADIGTINYDTGVIAVQNLTIDRYYGDAIKIYVLPRDPDVTINQFTILATEPEEIQVEVEELRL